MSKFGVLGTGVVGQTLATKLVALGHDVVMGAREATNENAQAWAATTGEHGRSGSFRDAAEFGDVVVNATSGAGALAALEAAGRDALSGKVVIDVSNPLDFSNGFPPSLLVANTDSLAEQLQRANPEAKVVKALNTVTASVMVDPASVPGDHHLFIAGDDSQAKADVVGLLATFGWPAQRVVDLGGIAAARASEAYVLFWAHLYAALGTPEFNIEVRGA